MFALFGVIGPTLRSISVSKIMMNTIGYISLFYHPPKILMEPDPETGLTHDTTLTTWHLK